MNAQAPPQQIILDLSTYTQKIQSLILAKAEELNCDPSAAAAALLDEIASKSKDNKTAA